MATQLQQQGERVALVALLDSNVPEHGPTWSPATRSLKYIASRLIEYLFAGRLPQIVRDAAKWRFKCLLSRWDSTLRCHLRMWQAHIKAQRSYVARPLAGRVLCLQSEQNSRNPLMHGRWAELATSEFKRHVVSGTTHRDLLLGTDWTPTLARILREHLDLALIEPTSAETVSVPFLRPLDDRPGIRTRRAA